MSAVTDARRCSAHGGPEWSPCEKPLGHDGRCYAWLPGFGPVQWTRKETTRAL